MKTLPLVLLLLFTFIFIVVNIYRQKLIRQNHIKSLSRLKTYLKQDRYYCVYLGVPLSAPTDWARADVEEQSLYLSEQPVEIEKINSFLISYKNGEVLDSENLLYPLPKNLHFIQEVENPIRDILDPSILSEGNSFAHITFGRSGSNPDDPDYYSTSFKNISYTTIRVIKFAGYSKINNKFHLNTISGDFFTATQFINWYGVSKDGWIQPDETVIDLNNYGSSDGYWVYYFETAEGKKSVVGAKNPV